MQQKDGPYSLPPSATNNFMEFFEVEFEGLKLYYTVAFFIRQSQGPRWGPLFSFIF